MFSVYALLVSPVWGLLGLLFLFALSFVGVHFVMILQKNLNPPRERKEDAPKPAPKKENKEPEAVYYIVERKKRRPKRDYSEPRQINFSPRDEP